MDSIVELSCFQGTMCWILLILASNTSTQEFEESLRVTSGHLHWSPNGKLCAVAVTARLEIREGSTLQLLICFNSSEYIQNVGWSPDSSLIYSANNKKGIIEVWQPLDPSWKCKIDEGAAGLIKVCWSPDSRHILTTAEFNLRITVWSLINKTILYIKYPKEASPGLQFSHDGDYLAVAERRDCKDYISIFETKLWTQVKNFEVNSRDLSGINWSHDDSVLAIWDCPAEYKVLIYTISGQCLASYSAYQWALGVKCVSWSPNSQFFAIGSYDQKIRLMNHITWKILAEFNHSKSVIEENDCSIYREQEKPLTGYPATLASVQGLPLYVETSYIEEASRPVNIASLPLDVKQPNPKVGISQIQFSSDGRFLSSRVDNMPSTVWIWSIPKLALNAILVHSNPVKDMAWSCKQSTLALCTGGGHLYLWTPFGCLTVAVPNAPSMEIISLRWHPSGSKIALVGKEQFSVCFLNAAVNKTKNQEEEEDRNQEEDETFF